MDYFSMLPDHLIAEIAEIMLTNPKGMEWMIRMACANKRVHAILFDSDYSKNLWDQCIVGPSADNANLIAMPPSIKSRVTAIGKSPTQLLLGSGLAILSEFPRLRAVAVGFRKTPPATTSGPEIIKDLHVLARIKTLTTMRMVDDVYYTSSSSTVKHVLMTTRLPKSIQFLELEGDLSTVLRVKSGTTLGKLSLLSLRHVYMQEHMVFQPLHVHDLRLDDSVVFKYSLNFFRAIAQHVVHITAPNLTFVVADNNHFGDGSSTFVNSPPCDFPELETLTLATISMSTLQHTPKLLRLTIRELWGPADSYDNLCSPTTIDLGSCTERDLRLLAALSSRLVDLCLRVTGKFDDVVPSLVTLSAHPMPHLRRLTIRRTPEADSALEAACVEEGLAFIRRLFPNLTCVEHIVC
jgi:hypothetical protein